MTMLMSFLAVGLIIVSIVAALVIGAAILTFLMPLISRIMELAEDLGERLFDK